MKEARAAADSGWNKRKRKINSIAYQPTEWIKPGKSTCLSTFSRRKGQIQKYIMINGIHDVALMFMSGVCEMQSKNQGLEPAIFNARRNGTACLTRIV